MARCLECGGSINYIKSDLAKCNYCGKVYSVINGGLKEVNLASIYDYASSKAKSQKEEDLQEAISVFESIGSYKDGYNRAMECRNTIKEQKALAEERRLEAQRQAKKEEIERERKTKQQRRALQIKGITIAIAIISVLIIVGISVYSAVTKRSQYNKAMELYHQQQYEEALEAFRVVEGYSDSQTHIADISKLIRERETAYHQGVSLYSSGLYEKAIEELTDISDYLDVKEYIENASKALYQQAKELADAEGYTEAKVKLESIPKESIVYTQVQVLLSEIDAILLAKEKAANYEMAVNYYNSQQYEMAQSLFIKLEGYEETIKYLSEIGTIFYNKAKGLYDQQEYAQCGDVLICIDSAEEWNEYGLATELYNQAAQAYKEIIVPEAKNICRSEGESAMKAYIYNAVCSVLPLNEADRLKDECYVKVISLEEIEPYIDGGLNSYDSYDSVENRTDILGNIYSFALGDAYRASNVYYINKQYTYLTATVAVQKNSENGRGEAGFIRIYGDNKLLWSDDNITLHTKSYDIQVDISGVTDLEIEIDGVNGIIATRPLTSLLADPKLSE